MKYVFFLLIVFGSFSLRAQEDALLFFLDKPKVEEFLMHPETMLSPKAIARKSKYGTLIDNRDVPVSENYIARIKNQEGIQVLSKSKWFNSVFVRGSQQQIENLLTFDFVYAIEFCDSQLNVPSAQSKKSSLFSIQKEHTFNYNYGSTLNQIEMIAVNKLHLEDFTGEAMTIAVMDSGFPNIKENPAFSVLISENRLVGTYDFVQREENVDGTGSHGSLTLSDMAGNLSGDFIGSAPQARYYLFRTEDATTENPVEEAWWLEALERADSLGVDVVNTSLGYRDFDDVSYNHSYQDLDGKTTIAARGATIAFEKGMLLVTSAGNGGGTYFETVGTPADAPNILTVGAVDSNGDYASFSSVGPTVDGRVKPDVVAQGQSAAVVDTTGKVAFVNGTSFSAPILAGAVACLWQALPQLTNAEIIQLVRESGSLYEIPTDQLGYGIPNFESALARGKVLNLKSELASDSFKIIENPVKNWVIFTLPEAIFEAKVLFFNLLGQQVMQSNITHSTNKIDVSQFVAGMYIAVISDGEHTNTFKVLKR